MVVEPEYGARWEECGKKDFYLVAKKSVNLRIAHLRIGHMVGNPEVGNPEPYESSGLPTSIVTLFSVYMLDLGW